MSGLSVILSTQDGNQSSAVPGRDYKTQYDSIAANQTTKSILYGTPFAAGTTQVVQAWIVNMVDGSPQMQMVNVAAQTLLGFTAAWDNQTATPNSFLGWFSANRANP